MSDLVFIAFDNEQKAEEVRDRILGMQREYLIEIGDAVIAVRDDKGRVKLNQLVNTTAAGAASGAFWGMLVGWLFMMPIAGAAVGAAGGALGGALTDIGINDADMKRQADEALKPGMAGLFLLIRKMTTDKVLEDLKGVGGTVIKTSFDHAEEEKLREALAGVAPPRRRRPPGRRLRPDVSPIPRRSLRRGGASQQSRVAQATAYVAYGVTDWLAAIVRPACKAPCSALRPSKLHRPRRQRDRRRRRGSGATGPL